MTTISYKSTPFSTEVKDAPLVFVLEAIKIGTWKTQVEAIRKTSDSKKQNEIKATMPLFYMMQYIDKSSGANQFSDSIHSGLLPFDIDGIPLDQALEFKAVLLNSKFAQYVRFAFISPRLGLKFAIQTNYQGNENGFYTALYKRLQAALEKLLGTKLDDSTCNRNRGTYPSYDPDLYSNPEAKVLDVSRHQETYDEEQRQLALKNAATQRAYAATIANSTHDEDKARQSMEKAFDSIMCQMGKGRRHGLIWLICKACFERGFGEHDAASYLLRAKAAGHYTESMSPEMKAKDSYRSWLAGGGQVNLSYMTRTIEQQKSVYAAIMGF